VIFDFVVSVVVVVVIVVDSFTAFINVKRDGAI